MPLRSITMATAWRGKDRGFTAHQLTELQISSAYRHLGLMQKLILRTACLSKN
jgi:hypothetical protein